MIIQGRGASLLRSGVSCVKIMGRMYIHPFIHCAMAWELQPMLFFLLGVSWVMPHFEQEMFGCWMGRFGPELRGDLEICSFVSNVVSLEGKECSAL